MQCLAISLGVFGLVGQGADGYNNSQFALWPQHMDTTLSVSVSADGLSIIDASSGGALGTLNMKLNTESNILFDPVLDTIEIVWIPPFDVHSSTFDHFWANSLRFDGLNAQGIHLQAEMRDVFAWNSIDEAVHERIETNVREILHTVLPSISILPELSKGFLAKSLCDFRSWTTGNPVQEILHTRVDKTPSLCYSSSFPLLPQNASTLFSKIIGEAEGCLGDSLMSEVENAVLETKQNFYTGKRRHRLAAVKLSRSPDSAVMIEAEFMEVWVSQPSTVKAPWRATFPVLANKSDFLVVTSTTREQDFDKLEYKLLEPGFPLSAITTQMSTISVAASVHAAVVGEGFHRRYVMDVELLENGICGGAFSDKTVLMRVPVSKTMYLDLDEIRRMERYNDLVLLSFTKHIEIERPSPVSSQYVVGLEFTIPSTNKARIEFPLHFRYQAPTENGMYRQASVIAPDLFLVCPNGDRFVKRKLKISNDDDAAAQNYFQTWGLTAMSHPASGDHRWLRLTTTSSIPVMDVHVPVGYLPSAWFVSSMTLLFASTGAALLLWISSDIAKKPQEPSTIGGASWKGKTD